MNIRKCLLLTAILTAGSLLSCTENEIDVFSDENTCDGESVTLVSLRPSTRQPADNR